MSCILTRFGDDPGISSGVTALSFFSKMAIFEVQLGRNLVET
jgi:hypothetical protein